MKRFELTKEPIGGYSGGLWQRDGRVSVSTVAGNTQNDRRKFVSITLEQLGVEVTFDRDDELDTMLRESRPLSEFATVAVLRLMPRITQHEFAALLSSRYEIGYRAGYAAAKHAVREALFTDTPEPQ